MVMERKHSHEKEQKIKNLELKLKFSHLSTRDSSA